MSGRGSTVAEPGLTSFGRSWERWHSLWTGWALGFFGLFSWLSFLYAGLRAGKRSWLIWSGVYALPWIPFIIAVPPEGQEDPPGFGVFDVAMVLFLILWVLSSIHAFRIRGEYLLRIAERRTQKRSASAGSAASVAATGSMQGGNRPPAAWYGDPAGGTGQRWWNGSEWTARTQDPSPSVSTIYSDTATPSGPSTTDRHSGAFDPESGRQDELAQPLDLNSAREEELAALPGIGGILSKRIVAERHERGGFGSVEEMALAVALKPHVLQRLRSLVTAGQRPTTPSERPRGRVVDF